jgi:glycosyltransferase involved in cell wall biosynthesis
MTPLQHSGSMPSRAPQLSIVIPVYNEEAILESSVKDLVDRLSSFKESYELVLAENGSRDNTVALAEELSKRFPQVRTFSLGEPNYGKALKRGILEAQGEIVICDEIDLCDIDFYKRALAILRVTLGFKGTDTHGLKAFKRAAVGPVAETCIVDKDLFASELVIRAERTGVVRMREIPVRVLEKRPPSIHLFRRVPNVLKGVARLVVAIRFRG